MAMIDLHTGRVRLADGLSLGAGMRAEDVRRAAEGLRGAARWVGDGTLVCALADFAGANALATASFRDGRLDSLRVELRPGKEMSPERQRALLMQGIGQDLCLTAALRPRAFSFPWGEVGLYADPHTGLHGVAIRYTSPAEG